MSLYDTLSRLLAGELSEEEEASVRARIASDPEAAEAWEHTLRLVAGLERLPDVPPPPDLARRVAGTGVGRWGASIGLGLALAAATAAGMLAWIASQPSPSVILTSGTQWVEGEVRVVTADAIVDVDGVAAISVEPPVGDVRETAYPTTEVDMKHRREILAGLAGSLVAVAVLEGTAVVSAGSGEAPVTVAAGETHTHGPPRAEAPAPAAERSRGEGGGALAAELERVREDLGRARLEVALYRGQLAAVQGEDASWPEDVPEAFTEVGLQEHLDEVLADLPSATLELMDCSEYPCLAVVGSDDESEGWGERLQAGVLPRVEADYGDGEINHTTFSMTSNETGRTGAFMILSVSDAATTTGNVRLRLEARKRVMMEILADQLQ